MVPWRGLARQRGVGLGGGQSTGSCWKNTLRALNANVIAIYSPLSFRHQRPTDPRSHKDWTGVDLIALYSTVALCV